MRVTRDGLIKSAVLSGGVLVAAGLGAYAPSADARGMHGGGGFRMWSTPAPVNPYYAYPPQFQYYAPPPGYSYYYPYNSPALAYSTPPNYYTYPPSAYSTQPNYPANSAQSAPSYSPAPSVTTAPYEDGSLSDKLLEHVVLHEGIESTKELIKTAKREAVPAGAAILTKDAVERAAARDVAAEGVLVGGEVVVGVELADAILTTAEIGLTFYLIYEIWRSYHQSEVITVPLYASRRRYYATQTFTYQMTEAAA
jgi:hypothetical protein